MIPLEPTRSDEAGIGFVVRLAKALHRFGIPAHRMEALLAEVSEKVGLEARFSSTPTAIFASFGPPEALRTGLIRADPGELDLGKLADLDDLATAVSRDQITLEEAAPRLDHILEAPHPYPPWMTALAFLLSSAGASYLLGGRGREVILGAAIGLWVALFALFASRRKMGRLVEAVGSFGGTLIALLAMRLLGPLSLQQSIIAGLIILLPGLSLTIAMTELATRHLTSGTTRMVGAVLILFEMGFGVALGSQLDPWLPPVPDFGPSPELPGWFLAPAMLFASAGFAVAFRAKGRDVPWVMASGAVSYFVARTGSAAVGPELGAFLGALALGMGSNAIARFRDEPASITLVPGLLLLVPGSLGYRSIDAFIGHDVTAGIAIAFSVVLIAVGIATGIVVSNVLVTPRRVL